MRVSQKFPNRIREKLPPILVRQLFQGIGELRSCFLTGETFQVYMRAHADRHVVVFGSTPTDEHGLDDVVESYLSKVPTA